MFEINLKMGCLLAAIFCFFSCTEKGLEITEYASALVILGNGEEPQFVEGGSGSKEGNVATVQEKVIEELVNTSVKTSCPKGKTYKIYFKAFKTYQESVAPSSVADAESKLNLVKSGSC